MKGKFTVEEIDLNNQDHVNGLLSLMNDYMMDDMGVNKELPADLGKRIVDGLLQQCNYIGFLLKYESNYVALANCFEGFSTFKAKKLINIHDFVVSPLIRKQGAGKALLEGISAYALKYDYCKITLEVRHDNSNAQRLYKKVGFTECIPPMYFWQKDI